MIWGNILAFVLATIVVGQLPFIPNNYHAIYALPFILAGITYRRLSLICVCLLGFIFSLTTARLYLDSKLEIDIQGQELELVGYVASLPKIGTRSIKFSFLTRLIDGSNPCLIDLSWYDLKPQPRAGERWKLLVRLTRPHGAVNPGLFDSEAWYLSRAVCATGSVRQNSENKRITAAGFRSAHHQLRAALRDIVTGALPADASRGILLALLIGESAQIDALTWNILTKTGTNHLLIISGLHVGLVAAITLYLGSFFLGRSKGARIWAASLTVISVCAYAALAGLGLPIQRAMIMVCVALLVLLSGRQSSVWLVVLYALLLVSTFNPFAGLSAGYWLSFCAVFSLVYVFNGRIKPRGIMESNSRDVNEGADGRDLQQGLIRGTQSNRQEMKALATSKVEWFRGLVKTQFVIFTILSPLLLIWTGQFTMVAFAVNLIAIPIVSMLIVPLLLLCIPFLSLGFFSPSIFTFVGYPLVWLAHWVIGLFLLFLESMSHMDMAVQYSEANLGVLTLTVVGGVILWAPKSSLPKWPVLIILLPLIQPREPKQAQESLAITVLDVGQGLSVILKMPNHTVVYDAGFATPGGFDSGSRIVVPVLRQMQVDKIHSLIISHGDADHSGGAEAIKRHFPIRHLYSSDKKLGVPCEGEWELDSFTFQFIATNRSKLLSDNDRSCVLMVSSEHFSLLLPGDIESGGEAYLLRQNFPFIDVMLAPHHGSRTSSSHALLNHIMPHIMVVSAGYMNRFNHPSPNIVRRYNARRIKVLGTAESGQIEFKVSDGLNASYLKVHQARLNKRRFWYDLVLPD